MASNSTQFLGQLVPWQDLPGLKETALKEITQSLGSGRKVQVWVASANERIGRTMGYAALFPGKGQHTPLFFLSLIPRRVIYERKVEFFKIFKHTNLTMLLLTVVCSIHGLEREQDEQ